MALLPAGDLRPGLTTAADVRDQLGQLLGPTGTVLTERHLRILHMCGIESVTVAGDDDPAAEAIGQIDPALLQAALESLRQRFRLCDLTHPVMRELHALAAARLAMARGPVS